MRKQQGSRGTLGTYESIWDGIDEELDREMISRELRKDHRRPIKKILIAAKLKSWKQVGIWSLKDLVIFIPIFGCIMLLVMLILNATN